MRKIDALHVGYPEFNSNCSAPVLFPLGEHKLKIIAYLFKTGVSGNVSVNANLVAGEEYFIRAESGSTPLNNGLSQLSVSQKPEITVWIESASGTPATQKAQIALFPLFGQNETEMLPMIPVLK